MEEIEIVRRKYYEEGKTISEIYSDTGIDRKTIRKYVNKEDWNTELNVKAVQQKIEPYKELIELWLTDDKQRKRKQRHTAKRVYNRLKEKYPDLEECDKDIERKHYRKDELISELFKEDIKNLNPLPSADFSTETRLTLRTDAYGRFCLDKCFYSSSPSLSSSTATVIKTHDKVIVLDKNKEVVRHERLYGENIESFDWVPYLKQLSRKPAALKYTWVYSMLPLNIRNFLEVTDKSKFLKLLAELAEETGFNSAVSLIEEAMEYNVNDLDSIIAFKRSHGNLDIKPLTSPHIPEVKSLNLNIDKYNMFLGREK